MAKNSGDYYEGVEPNPENQTRRGNLGALIGLGGASAGGQQAPQQAPQMGRMMAPQEDFETLRERNKTFLKDPATQAALFTFASGMLTPISNNGDLMGLFGNSMMNAAKAAAGVEEAQLAENLAMQKARMEAAKVGLDFDKFDLEQRKFFLEQGNAKRGYELDTRKQDFEERKFTEEQKLKGRTTSSSIVSADDPLNKQFGLGLSGKEKARVEITRDANGRMISASVLGEFGDDGEVAPTEVSKLQAERQAALDRGDQKAAGELQDRISQLTQETSMTTGTKLVTDPSGEQRIENIKGGKAEAEANAAAAAAEKEKRAAQVKFDALNANIADSLYMIENPIEFGGKKIPPGAYLTGIGSLSQYIPGTPAKDLQSKLTSIRARISFEELQNMRKDSPTGGALGNVSNMENIMLQNAYYSVEQSQSAAQLVRNLNRLQNMLTDVVHGGQMSAIAKQVEKGEKTESDFMQAANSLFGAPQQGNSFVKPAESEQDLSLPPANLSEEDRELWPFYNDATRRGILDGSIK